jgi:hypothetical protein
VSTASVAHDVRSLSDYAWSRLLDRIDGMTDDEYQWEAAPGVPTIAWRLHHIGSTLAEDRNARWLGLAVASEPFDASLTARTASEALLLLDRAYTSWTSVLDAIDAKGLSETMGPAAGAYGDATRLSFVLHVLDELIHHAAEVALLRDLYRARSVVM